MARVERTVFLSYRRTNIPWALAIYQDLTNHGFDVFIDFEGIASGAFEEVILENIRSRAHFVVLLTPSALEQCVSPEDWLRREIETAIEWRRNIVPLMLEGFSFKTPAIANQLTGPLSALCEYNGLDTPASYFREAMQRLRERHLNVALNTVLHPASTFARVAATEQRVAADAAPKVKQEELTAQQYFERGLNAKDAYESLRFYREAIRLDPEYSAAYNNRGLVLEAMGQLEGALKDFEEALRLKGNEDPRILNNRGSLRQAMGDLKGAMEDYNEAIRQDPLNYEAFTGRGIAQQTMGDVDGAIRDFDHAIRLNSEYCDAHYSRGIALQETRPVSAIESFRKYLELGGGLEFGDGEKVEGMISRLEKYLAHKALDQLSISVQKGRRGHQIPAG